MRLKEKLKLLYIDMKDPINQALLELMKDNISFHEAINDPM
jgi:hypothetical protein